MMQIAILFGAIIGGLWLTNTDTYQRARDGIVAPSEGFGGDDWVDGLFLLAVLLAVLWLGKRTGLVKRSPA